MRLVCTILHDFQSKDLIPRSRPAYLLALHVLRSSWAPMRSTWLVSLWTTKSSLTRWAEAIWMTEARRTPKNSPHKLIFGGCLRMKELPTISFDYFFVFFFLNSRKKHGFGDGLGGLSDVDDGVNWFGFQWIYFKRQTSLWLEHDLQWDDVVPGSSQVCKACACSLSPQKTKPKGKYSTYLEDPNMFIIRVIGPRRKKGSLNLICCFLFFVSISWPFKWCYWWLIPVFPCWECWLVLIFHPRQCQTFQGWWWTQGDSGNGMMLQAKFWSSSTEAWLHFPSKFGLNQKPCSQ